MLCAFLWQPSWPEGAKGPGGRRLRKSAVVGLELRSPDSQSFALTTSFLSGKAGEQGGPQVFGKETEGPFPQRVKRKNGLNQIRKAEGENI